MPMAASSLPHSLTFRESRSHMSPASSHFPPFQAISDESGLHSIADVLLRCREPTFSAKSDPLRKPMRITVPEPPKHLSPPRERSSPRALVRPPGYPSRSRSPSPDRARQSKAL